MLDSHCDAPTLKKLLAHNDAWRRESTPGNSAQTSDGDPDVGKIAPSIASKGTGLGDELRDPCRGSRFINVVRRFHGKGVNELSATVPGTLAGILSTTVLATTPGQPRSVGGRRSARHELAVPWS